MFLKKLYRKVRARLFLKKTTGKAGMVRAGSDQVPKSLLVLSAYESRLVGWVVKKNGDGTYLVLITGPGFTNWDIIREEDLCG